MPDGDKKNKDTKYTSEDYSFKLNALPSAFEEMGYSPDVYRQAYSDAGDLYDETYGEPTDPLSEEEAADMRTLQMRREQLSQPVQTPQPTARRIQGNPYSVSLRGVQQGLYNLLGEQQRANREDQLYGEPDAVEKYSQRARDKRGRAKELRSQIEAMRTPGASVEEQGITNLPDESVQRGVEQDILEDMEQEAQALEAEAEQDEQRARKKKGVIPKLAELGTQQQRAEQEGQQKDQFVQNVGDQIVQQQREKARMQAQMERELALANERTRRRLIEASKNSSEDGTVVNENGLKIPNINYDPAIVRDEAEYHHDYLDEKIEQIENVYSNPYGDGLRPKEEWDEEDRDLYNTVLEQRQFLDEIRSAAKKYNRAESEDELPNYNYEENPQKIKRREKKASRMRELGVPDELINAYYYYNQLVPPDDTIREGYFNSDGETEGSKSGGNRSGVPFDDMFVQ